ncbi:hypothetical protein [Natrinema sp. 74]|uniref:hypothetical protein n=1 Tax=Natrinema sp. 74 TaxID=3384159 RepID=UPI0038D48582
MIIGLKHLVVDDLEEKIRNPKHVDGVLAEFHTAAALSSYALLASIDALAAVAALLLKDEILTLCEKYAAVAECSLLVDRVPLLSETR